MKPFFRRNRKDDASEQVVITLRTISAEVRRLTAIAKETPNLVHTPKGGSSMQNALTALEPLLEAVAEAHSALEEAVETFRALSPKGVA